MKKRILLPVLLLLTVILALSSCFNSIANKKVQSITVLSGAPAEVEVDKTPDFSGIQLEVSYNDNTKKTVGFSDITVSSIDTSRVGKKTYTVTYDGFSIELTINVVQPKDDDSNNGGTTITEATLESVTYLSGIPTEIFLGADFHTTELKLTAHYSDGSTSTVTSDKITIIQNIKFDEASDVGTQTLIVEYQGKKCEIKVVVKPIEAVRFELDTTDFVGTVLIGKSLDTSTITGTLYYNNSTQQKIDNADITFGSIDLTTAGTKTLTGTYNGMADECNVTVLGVKSITVTGYSNTVKPGEDVDLSDIKVKITASNNSVIYIDKSEITVDKSAYDSSLVGTDSKSTQLIFSYGGVSLNANITVKATRDDAELSSIVYNGGVENEIFVGQSFDDSGISAKANLTYGFSSMLTKADLTLSGTVNSDVAGTYTLTYSYTLDGITKSFNITVTVVVPTPTELVLNKSDLGWVVKGEELDTTGITATLKYNYAGKTLTLANSDLEITNTATGTAGEFEVTVAYNGITATAAYTVVSAVKVEVESGLRGTVTLGNAAYDDKLAAKITLSNGETVIRTQDQGLVVDNSAYDSSKEGETSITLTFGDASAVIPVDVVVEMDVTLQKIEIQSGLPNFIYAGDAYDYSSLKITAYYNYNITESYEIADGVAITTEGSTAVAGTYKIIASYTHEGVTKTAEFAVEVRAVEATELVIDRYTASILLGDSYSTDGITATLKYNNGTEKALSASDLAFSINVSSAGTAALTAAHAQTGLSASVNVTVVGISSVTFNGVASSYRVNDLTIDTDNITITIVGTDGKAYIRSFNANATIPTLTLNNTLNEETKEYSFTYCGVEYKQAIKVYAEFADAELISIEYTGATGTFVGVTITDKISVQANYTYGFTETYYAEDGVAISGLDVSKKGDYTITVTYAGKSATATVSVTYPGVTNIIINNTPLAIKGEAYDYDSINLTITLETNETLTAALWALADYNIQASLDISVAGDNTLTLSANGKTYTATVKVYEIEKIIIDTDGFETIIALGSTFSTDSLGDILVYLVGMQEPIIREALSFQHNVNTAVAGEYTITTSYLGVTSASVKVIVAEQYFIVTDAVAPSAVVAWQNGTYSEEFLDSGYAYVVGDDNAFKFELTFSMFDIINEVTKTGSSVYEGVSTVTLNGSAVGSEYVTIDEVNHTFDFTEAAIGKTFVITSAHKDYPEYTKSHTVTIVDGYNIHDAKELNLLTNVNRNIGNSGSYQMTVLYNFLQNNRIAGIESMTYDQYVSFVNGIKGIILHGNITPTVSDLPSEYFFELSDGTKYLWNDQYIYYHAHTDTSKYNDSSASAAEFNVYGNYFTVYSYNIPTVAPAGSVDKNGVTTNSDGLSTSQLFCFDVSSTIDSLIDQNNAFYHHNYVTNFYAFGMRDDNPSVAIQPELAQIRSKLGVIGLKVRNGEYNLNSVNSEAFFISFFPDYNDVTANVDYCTFYNAWNCHIMTYPDNMYDTLSNGDFDGSLHAGAAPATVNITNSFVGKAGGPAILNMIVDPSKGENQGMDVVINIDANSNVFSYVKGNESWFDSFGATSIANDIYNMNQLFLANGSSYTTTVANDVFMNMICVNIDSSFNPATGAGTTTNLNPIVNIGGSVKLDMSNTDSTSYGHGGIVDQILQNASVLGLGQPPVFVSDNIYGGQYWGACYTDGTNLYDAYAGTELEKSALYKGGSHLCLYYYNLGILLGYNEATYDTEPAPEDCTVVKITAAHGYN